MEKLILFCYSFCREAGAEWGVSQYSENLPITSGQLWFRKWIGALILDNNDSVINWSSIKTAQEFNLGCAIQIVFSSCTFLECDRSWVCAVKSEVTPECQNPLHGLYSALGLSTELPLGVPAKKWGQARPLCFGWLCQIIMWKNIDVLYVFSDTNYFCIVFCRIRRTLRVSKGFGQSAS